MHKIAFIVPASKSADVNGFLDALTKQIAKKNPDLNYEFVVVRQADEGPLNAGWLCNVGVQVTDAAYFVFHSSEPLTGSDADYRLEDAFVEMGGVQIMPVEIYSEVNGYSNCYPGTNVHTADMFERCIRKGIFMSRREANFPPLTFDVMEQFKAGKRVGTNYDRSKDGMSSLVYRILSTDSLPGIKGKVVLATAELGSTPAPAIPTTEAPATTQAPPAVEELANTDGTDPDEFHTFWRTRGEDDGAERGV
jgi:hypothetical protein